MLLICFNKNIFKLYYKLTFGITEIYFVWLYIHTSLMCKKPNNNLIVYYSLTPNNLMLLYKSVHSLHFRLNNTAILYLVLEKYSEEKI